jgi:hypothetical protein
MCLKFVDGSAIFNIPAATAKTWRRDLIHRADDVNTGGIVTEWPRWFSIQMMIPRNGILGVNNDGMTFKRNDCAPNDFSHASKVNINGASMTLV